MLAGPTAKGRKGTAETQVRRLFETADPEWERNNFNSLVSSGEGILDQIRDASEPKRDRRTGEMVVEDPGVADKRLMLMISEFGVVFKTMRRDGNTVSGIIRELWNCPRLIKPATKHNKTKVTEPYVSIMAHITIDELKHELDSNSATNGFGKGFLYVLSRRENILPEGGWFDAGTTAKLDRIARDLKEALVLAKGRGQVFRSPAAIEMWGPLYRRLTSDRPGMFGVLTSRAEPQVLRLALIFALLDRSEKIECVHLKAAELLWRYCEASTQYIWGDSLGNPLADRVRTLLQHAGKHGMSRSELYASLGNHSDKSKLSAALSLLAKYGLARCVVLPGSGFGASGMVERWFAT
jgi:hypothetical protein